MKKLAKILVLVIVCAMMLAMVSACAKTGTTTPSGSTPSGSTPSGSTPSGGTSTPSGGTSTPSGGSTSTPAEPYEVVIYYMYWWTQPTEEGTKDVEKAVSARLAELGYNYTLKIKWISLFEYGTQIDLILASGEKCDIVFNSNFSNMVDNGYLVALDPYLDNEMADAVELLGDWMICGKLKGATYGLPCHRTQCVTYCYNYAKSYVDAINYDMSQVKDFYDIEDLFAELKAANPTMRCDVDGSRYAAIVAEDKKTAVIGTYGATVGDDKTIVNYFETDAWKTALDYSYRFKQLGYTNPSGSEDSAKTSEWPTDIQIGIIIGYGSSESAQAEMHTDRYEVEAGSKCLQITNLSTIGISWGVSYTSKNPAAAATVLGLMWSDEKILNTMMYGVEGIDYVFDEDGLMQYPEGLDENTVPYQMALNSGVFSDMFAMYPTTEAGRQNLIYNKELIDNAWVVPLFGFTPANDEISTEISAVSNVYNQYHDTLVYGDSDPEEMNARFLADLKTAGIDVVIDEYNAQVAEWLAQ